MKRFVSYVAAGMLAGAFAGPGLAMAQTGGANGAAAGGPVTITSAGAPVSDLPMNQYKAFDDFRAAHPDIAHDLARNPRLINSGRFQRQHPALHDFLSQNGDFAQDFSENPSDYILPARPHAHPRSDKHASSRTENANTSANASAGTNGGGANAGAGASANTPANSAGAAPNGVPAASGGAGEGNASGGNM